MCLDTTNGTAVFVQDRVSQTYGFGVRCVPQ
jgi:hypothetical protein